MNFLGLAANAIIITFAVTAVAATAVAAYRRLPKHEPLQARSHQRSGQTDTSTEAAHLARDLARDPAAAYATLLATAQAAGMPPDTLRASTTSARASDTERLLAQLETHLGLSTPANST